MFDLAKFFTGGNITTASVIWPLMIGAFVAVVISHVNKRTVGKLVDKLLSAKADSEASAQSLTDLGMGKKSSLKYALRPSSTLSNIIKTTEDGRLYIPEDKAYRAETIFSPNSTSLKTVIFSAILFICAALGLLHLVPFIMKLVGGIF